MRYFVSVYSFFKKFQNWRLAQMTPVFTFFERPPPCIEDPSTVKINFVVSAICNFLSKWSFFTFFEPPIYTHKRKCFKPQSQLFCQMKRFLPIYRFKKDKLRENANFHKIFTIGLRGSEEITRSPPPLVGYFHEKQGGGVLGAQIVSKGFPFIWNCPISESGKRRGRVVRVISSDGRWRGSVDPFENNNFSESPKFHEKVRFGVLG